MLYINFYQTCNSRLAPTEHFELVHHALSYNEARGYAQDLAIREGYTHYRLLGADDLAEAKEKAEIAPITLYVV